MEFEIKLLKPKDEKRWGDFVMENDRTTFYHQIGWKLLDFSKDMKMSGTG